MIQEYQLRVLPEIAANEQRLKEYLSEEKGLNLRNINATRILKRSIDARQRTIFVNLKIRAYINEMPEEDEYEHTVYNSVEGKPQVIVVGAGPGGLFAALRLIELGLRPVIVERGKDVRERKKDLAQISREHTVNPESNYSFGEGGAGAYSDGKLYTRSKKRGNVDKIFNVFCQHGASTAILADAHPHIGTDKLVTVVQNIRKKIIALGGEYRFGECLCGLAVEENRLRAVQIRRADGTVYEQPTEKLILAVGHSARDTFEMLYEAGVVMERKPFSIGARIEHLQTMIDAAQYGRYAGRAELGAADYKLAVHLANGRSAYTFCMCPGGEVVAAASEPGRVVTNGMSLFARNKENANAALLVGVNPEDFGGTHPLQGMFWQRELEAKAFELGGGNYHAPAQLVGDFLAGRASSEAGTVRPSYRPGVKFTDLARLFPPYVTETLRQAILQMDRKLKGFANPDAVLTAIETRSSSPVRILRDETFQSNIRGLYPCGEGAGYAGGIVSSAVDGLRICIMAD